MNRGDPKAVLVANIPCLLVTAMAVYTLKQGHEMFAVALLVLAFCLGHVASGDDDE